MDYEQKYKEALERMKSWVKSEHPEYFSEAQKAAEFIFPELKENEDELMRKEAISIVKQYNIICEREGDKCWTADRVIAWLEKPKYTEEDLDKAYKCADKVQYKCGYEDAKKEIEKQDEQEETPCDRCRKAQPSHSCQDRTELGRCYLEHENQDEKNTVWSEEVWIDRACMLLDELNHLETLTLAKIPHNVDEIISHIKSLKNRVQQHWKPTEEQLMALRDAIDNNEMESLYNDLKKL